METTETNPLSEHPRTVLAYGTPVRLSFVDLYGFCGRELHPCEADVGFLGVVRGVHVSFSDADGCLLDRTEGVPGGTLVPRDLDYACYVVEAPDGRRLELMDHEVEDMSVAAALAA